jgi:parallel beta-helix repeat protein
MANFTVTNLNDSGAGSLRAAIQASNAGPAGIANTISFGVAGTIVLASDLPSIINPTSIVAGNPAVGSAPTVGINFNGHAGLVFAAGSDGSQLVGVSVGNAQGHGITLNASSIVLNNNYVGVALNGSALGNTGDGVYVSATSSGNQIGYNPDAAAVVTNVISGNGGNGISLHGSSSNTIVSNRIGTSVDGTTAIANGGNGIWVTQRSNGNTIGGDVIGVNAEGEPNDPTNDEGQGGPNGTQVIATPPLGNLVSGNGQNGILIDTRSQNNLLQGNFVGTDVTGNAPLGNAGDGIAINGANNNSLIGCLVDQNPFVYYNVVSGNGANGLHVTNSNNVLVQANFFGIGANNAVTVGNALNGILIDGSSRNTKLGGIIPLGNVSSGNGENGVEVADTASGFLSFNTFAGLFAFYGAAPNGNDGLLITSTGGNQTVQTNIFSGNLNNGMEIAGNASGVTAFPNAIGISFQGNTALPNGNNGVLITDTAHGNTIGGTGILELTISVRNTLSGNVNYGLAITGQAYDNKVFANGIGTDIRETAAVPNGAGGILLSSTGPGNVIGVPEIASTPGPAPANLLNVISGNNGPGITIAAGAHGSSVVNNWIGLDNTGQPVLPNSGLAIQNDSTGNLVYGNFGVVVVDDGQSATGLKVYGPSTLEVYDGGTVSRTTVYAGGTEVVYQGAVSHDTTVARDGTLQLLGGIPGDAVVSGTTTVKSGGILKAFGLGIASGATLSHEGAATAGAVLDNGKIQLKGGTFQADSLAVGTTAKGTVTQNDGATAIGGLLRVADGAGAAGSSYSLTSGLLSAAMLTVGAGGKFSQSGGGAFVSGAVIDDGSMSLSATSGLALLDAGSLAVGMTGVGSFTQNSGMAHVSGGLSIASGGAVAAGSAYTIKSGMLSAGSLSVATGGKFNQQAGATTVAGAVTDNGSISLTLGMFSATSLAIGSMADGRFKQTGGTAMVSGAITIASGGAAAVDSSYSISGGLLVAMGLIVDAGGSYSQSNGSTTIAGTVSDDGTISLTTGSFSAATLDIGSDSAGRFTQKGGFSTIGGTITISPGTASAADDSSFSMRGGTLNAAGLAIDAGGSFSQSGGTTTIGGDVSNGASLTVSGGTLAVGGDMNGTGKVSLGAGTLHVDGAVSSGQSLKFSSSVASLLELGQADMFHGTVAGFDGDDAIDLQDFAFASTSIAGVTGTGAAKTYTNVSLTDGTQTATIALYNQYANQFAVTASAYTLSADSQAMPGTLFELATPVT